MSTGRTLVIHSGTFKTGSSAIQLYLNRAEHYGVLAAAGARYPATGKSTGIQHANLVAELRRDRVFMPGNGGWDALLSEMATHEARTTIVSSESFSTLTPAELEQLGDHCRRAGVAVRWVHYVREQPGFFNAFYVERIVALRPDLHAVLNLPFEDFGAWSPIDLGFLSYASFADQVRKGVPGVTLELRPFSREHLVDGDVVRDFCTTVGIPFEAAYGATTNVGTGWRTVETARRLVPLIREFNIARQVKLAPNRAAARQRWLQLIRGELVAATTDVGWNVESAIYMTVEHRARLVEQYHEENARLDTMVDFPWLQIVEASRMKPANIGDFATISAEELLSVMGRVLPVVYRMPEQVQKLVYPSDEPSHRSLARRAASAARLRLRG